MTGVSVALWLVHVLFVAPVIIHAGTQWVRQMGKP